MKIHASVFYQILFIINLIFIFASVFIKPNKKYTRKKIIWVLTTCSLIITASLFIITKNVFVVENENYKKYKIVGNYSFKLEDNSVIEIDFFSSSKIINNTNKPLIIEEVKFNKYGPPPIMNRADMPNLIFSLDDYNIVEPYTIIDKKGIDYILDDIPKEITVNKNKEKCIKIWLHF
jgi:hypothetical protein